MFSRWEVLLEEWLVVGQVVVGRTGDTDYTDLADLHEFSFMVVIF